MLNKTYPSRPEGHKFYTCKVSSESTDSSLLAPTTFVHSEQASPISEGVAEIQINSHLAREIT
jgi:hypothetical protein